MAAFSDETIATHSGNEPEKQAGTVNPPIYKASTILFPSMEALRASDRDRYAGTHYGLYGTPTTFALEKALAELEGADQAIAVPSGLAAITASLLAFTKPGDHILMVDSTYGPTRKFCDSHLAQFNITTTYYDPMVGDAIAKLIESNTKIIFMESPGSGTFEVQDVPAIAAIARERNIITMLDNTWATPLYFKAFEHGVDISLHAATKYIAGHSDIMMGIINTKKEYYRRLKNQVHGLGMSVSPQDCYEVLRGLRSLAPRLKMHGENALKLAEWLKERPEVKQILHPAFPDHPGHSIFVRDFKGSSGVFAIELHQANNKQIAAMVDHMRFFGLGYSWGGYESLILPMHEDMIRKAGPKRYEGPILRLQIGLEGVEDLKEDLQAGLERLAGA